MTLALEQCSIHVRFEIAVVLDDALLHQVSRDLVLLHRLRLTRPERRLIGSNVLVFQALPGVDLGIVLASLSHTAYTDNNYPRM